MKLERIPEYVLSVTVVAIGLVVAMYAGASVGGGDTRIVAMLIAVGGMAIMGMTMKSHIWLIIPAFSSLSGPLMLVPGNFRIGEITMMVAAFWYLIFFATKRINVKATYSLIDVVLLINLLWIVFAFCRNPVGSLATGSDRVGGRPYLEMVIAMGGYFVLTHTVASLKTIRLLPIIVLGGGVVQMLISATTFFIPATVPIIAKVYGGIEASAYNAGGVEAAEGRSAYRFLGNFGKSTIAFLCAYFSPGKLLNPLYFGRFLLAAGSLCFVLISGARTIIISVIVIFFFSAFYRRKFSEIILSSIIGCGLLLGLVLVQGRLVELPFSVQRTLSFLPGDWSVEALDSAKDSTDWRLDMWKIALSDQRYIKDKWFGDGFGFSNADLQANLVARTADSSVNKEAFMIAGDFHSGPVSSIRFVGYVGLGLYMFLAILNAINAHRLIRRCAQTPLFPTSLFFGIPAVFHPFGFIVIFGAYDVAIFSTIYSIGILNLLQGSLDCYLAEQRKLKELEDRLPERIRVVF